jgi:hypothetical protein
MASSHRVSFDIQPEALAELGELAKRHEVPDATQILRDRIALDKLREDLGGVIWEPAEDRIVVYGKNGTELEILVGRDMLEAVRRLRFADAIPAATADEIFMSTTSSAPGNSVLDADPATQLAWVVALLTAVLQIGRFATSAAGDPLPESVSSATDALLAIAAVLVLILTRNESD